MPEFCHAIKKGVSAVFAGHKKEISTVSTGHKKGPADCQQIKGNKLKGRASPNRRNEDVFIIHHVFKA